MALHETHRLVAHAAMPPLVVESVDVTIGPIPYGLEVIYTIWGPSAAILQPAKREPRRVDGLWQTTCLELFIRQAGTAYDEFNFSPSGEWAAYRFLSYRDGAVHLPSDRPAINIWQRADRSVVSIHLDMPRLPSTAIGLSAVIEELNGTKSYWALAHPNPEKPDFHDPACFTLQLPAPRAA